MTADQREPTKEEHPIGWCCPIASTYFQSEIHWMRLTNHGEFTKPFIVYWITFSKRFFGLFLLQNCCRMNSCADEKHRIGNADWLRLDARMYEYMHDDTHSWQLLFFSLRQFSRQTTSIRWCHTCEKIIRRNRLVNMAMSQSSQQTFDPVAMLSHIIT